MFWISFFFLANVILGEHQITKRSLAGFETVEVSHKKIIVLPICTWNFNSLFVKETQLFLQM